MHIFSNWLLIDFLISIGNSSFNWLATSYYCTIISEYHSSHCELLAKELQMYLIVSQRITSLSQGKLRGCCRPCYRPKAGLVSVKSQISRMTASVLCSVLQGVSIYMQPIEVFVLFVFIITTTDYQSKWLGKRRKKWFVSLIIWRRIRSKWYKQNFALFGIRRSTF